jgi:hypothetical protein
MFWGGGFFLDWCWTQLVMMEVGMVWNCKWEMHSVRVIFFASSVVRSGDHPVATTTKFELIAVPIW